MNKITAFIKRQGKSYWAYSPSLTGCYSQGPTKKAVVANFTKAANVHLAARKTIEKRLARKAGIQTVELTLGSRA
ncbi:MAG: type II toxin-antitoxin system HicB family antitoxin [bacterium]